MEPSRQSSITTTVLKKHKKHTGLFSASQPHKENVSKHTVQQFQTRQIKCIRRTTLQAMRERSTQKKHICNFCNDIGLATCHRARTIQLRRLPLMLKTSPSSPLSRNRAKCLELPVEQVSPSMGHRRPPHQASCDATATNTFATIRLSPPSYCNRIATTPNLHTALTRQPHQPTDI